MKRRSIICLLLAFLVICSSFPVSLGENTDQSSPIRVLAIGNSFTHDTFEYLPQIAEAAGYNMEFGVLYIGGSQLSQHADNAKNDLPNYEYGYTQNGKWIRINGYTIRQALETESWDYVSLQQQAVLAGIPESLNDIPFLMDYIRSYCPEVKFIWNMTWSYTDAANDFNVRQYFTNHTTHYQAIVKTAQEKILTNPDIVILSPTGTAIENARTSDLGKRQATLFRDNIHLSMYWGRYIAGMTFFSALTGFDVEKLSFDDENYKAIAVESVKNAMAQPFEKTTSRFPVSSARLYTIPTDSLYGLYGGWKAHNGSKYSWLVRGNRGWKYDVQSQSHTLYGSILSLRMQETDRIDLLYSLNLPDATGISPNGRLQFLFYSSPDAFPAGSAITIHLCSGEKAENSLTWHLPADQIVENTWQTILLPFDQAEKNGGEFNPSQFKELHIFCDQAEKDALLQWAQIELEDLPLKD